jgi:REP element-mobilizing transposase RayT
MTLPTRQTERLRLGRVSMPHARYFLTLCVQDRRAVLTASAVTPLVTSALHAIHDGDGELLAATIMPDHLHVLFALGTRLTLSQVMGKLKTLARSQGRAPWHWQENGFEHRLRADEAAEDYAFYVFMNPYRAHLLPVTQSWPWWICPDPTRFRFLSRLGPDGTPPGPWLGEIEIVAARIAAGE